LDRVIKIDHISLDLWGTLIQSNPEFKKRRSLFIFEKYNPNNRSIHFINRSFKTIGYWSDQMNMICGTKISSKKMYSFFLFTMGFGKIDIQNCIESFINEIADLFLLYPPICDSSSIDVLLQLKKKYTINISSNTGYIEGETIKKYFQNSNLNSLIDFYVFSDEIKSSKPYMFFFKKVKEISGAKTILHIGDNKFADGIGAYLSGIKTEIISSKNSLNQLLLKYV
jgi:putative hydrolase of the HAD superfamily